MSPVEMWRERARLNAGQAERKENLRGSRRASLVLVAFLLGATVTSHAEHAFRLISEMDRTPTSGTAWSYAGWASHNVSYYDVVEASTNLYSQPLGHVAALPCNLGKTLPPGTYDLWVAFAAQGADMKVGCSVVGDTSVAPLQYSGNRWTKIGQFTSGVSFSSLTLEVTKLLGLNKYHKYWFAGVGVTSPNLSLLGDYVSSGAWYSFPRVRWADLTSATTTNMTSSTGNLLPNSSFEVNGLKTAGWSSGRHATNPVVWLSDMAGGEGWHGNHSAVISSLSGSRYRLYGPTLFLPGVREVRPYTLSFYARAPDDFVRLSVYWNHSLEGAQGVRTNQEQQIIFDIDPATGWKRYQTTLWIDPVPNRGVWFDFAHVYEPHRLLIDAIQFEEGETATPYAPADPVEFGISTPHPNGNLFAPGEARVLQYEFWNNTASGLTVSVRTEVYDYLNRRVANLTNSFQLGPGFSTQNLTLTTTNMGQSRVVAWCNHSPSARTEMTFSVAPTVPFDVASSFGIHGLTSIDAGSSNVAWGLGWERGLSVAGFINWKENEPEQDTYDWTRSDLVYDQMRDSGYEIFASLSSSVPSWALNGGVPDLIELSNYVYDAVSRYPAVRYWESFNEPRGWGSTDAVGAWTATTYAQIEETLINAVRNANPTARYIAFGGVASTNWAQDVWDLLPAAARSKVYGISCHLYPNVQGGTTPDDDTRFEQWKALGDQIGKPVWNTESGVWGWGDYKGDKVGGTRDLVAPHPHQTEHDVRRMNWEQPAVAMRNVINSLGNGFERYFYYDARLSWYNWKIEATQPSLFNFDDSINSVGTAYLWAKHFIDLADSTAPVANAGEGDIRAYLFQRATPWSTLALFTRSRQANYSVTLDASALGSHTQLEAFDMMGNPLPLTGTTFEVGTRPVYVISDSPSLANAFEQGTVSVIPDVTAPHVSIDLSPHGRPTERSMPHRIWLTAIDDLQVPGDETPNNVLTRWRLMGGAWSEWSMQRYFELETPPAFSRVEAQAKDLAGNVSDIVHGPLFGSLFATAEPAAPTGFQASAVSGFEINLSWTDASDNEFGFRIERSTDGTTFAQVAEVGVDTTAYSDTGLAPETLYQYRIHAFNNVGDSPYALTDETTPTTLVPPAPTNLLATGGNAVVDLQWDAVGTADSYNLKRSTSPVGPYSSLAPGLTQTSYTDNDVVNGTTYHYVVSGVNTHGEGPNSLPTSATPVLPVPPAPASLVAVGGDGAVVLQWGTAATAQSYNLKRSTSAGGPYVTLASDLVQTSHTDNTVLNGTPYYYVVSGVNSYGEGPDSPEASATPEAPPPPGGIAPIARYDLDEGAGTVAADSGPGGFDGTLMGTTSWVVGQRGTAVRFDDSSGYVRVDSVPEMNFGANDSFTVTAWVRSTPGYKQTSMLLGKQSSDINASGFGLWTLNHDNSLLYARLADTAVDGNDNTGFLSNANGPFINDGEWHHVALVVDRSTGILVIYTDGVPSAEYDLTSMGADGLGALSNSSPFVLGGPASWHRYNGGAVDEVRLYDQALTTSQILEDKDGLVPGGGGGQPALVYDNSATDQSLRFETQEWEVGDEINLDAGGRVLDGFDFEFYYLAGAGSLAGTPTVQVRLYANNGDLFNDYATPGTLLYDSGILTGLISAFTERSTLVFGQGDFTTPVLLPDTLTWSVQFGGIGANRVGLDVYGPPVVGSSSRDYWFNDGSGWRLREDADAQNATPLNFAARFSTVSFWADTTPPIITLNGQANMTLECGVDSYNEPGATVFDAGDPNVTVVIGGDTVDTGTPGTYLVTYDAADASGNQATQVTRTVIVEDTRAPVITLNGTTTMSVALNGTWIDPGATATDICDGTVAVSVGGDVVDTSVAGTYIITYDAVDAAGNNAAQVTRTVTVFALQAGDDLIQREGTNRVKVAITALLGNDANLSGGPVQFVSADTISTGGGSVQNDGTWLHYTPPSGSVDPDDFTYTIDDGGGETATGQVTVEVVPNEAPSSNVTITDLGNGSVRVAGDGIPGYAYHLEYAVSPASPVVWVDLEDVVADQDTGHFEYDHVGGSIEYGYRTTYP